MFDKEEKEIVVKALRAYAHACEYFHKDHAKRVWALIGKIQYG